MEIIRIEFIKSKSAKFTEILSLAKGLPNYVSVGEKHIVSISDIKEYFLFDNIIMEIIDTVKKWKHSIILLYGKEYKTAMDFYDFMEILKKNAGKYAMLVGHQEKVALGDVSIESLPLPIVLYPELYGSFFAFSEDIGEDIYFCECEKKAINNYLLLMYGREYSEDGNYPLDRKFPPIIQGASKTWVGNPQKYIKYKEGLCFKCNKTVPKKTYCHQMYGGQFKQHYGWYVNQEYLKLGIGKNIFGKYSILPEECTPELYDNVQRINQLVDRPDYMYGDMSVESIKKSIERVIENSVREQFGIKKIGDSWVSETILFNIVKGLFPDENIKRHFRPKWLEGLELDIYLPDMKMGFEYQGIQHFKPIKHWGGEEKLQIQKEHDERKKKLCENLGIKLICVNYDEPLTTNYIRQKTL